MFASNFSFDQWTGVIVLQTNILINSNKLLSICFGSLLIFQFPVRPELNAF